MGWQLRNCCREMVRVAVLLSWLCVASVAMADSLQRSMGGNCPSTTADSLKLRRDEQTSPWELLFPGNLIRDMSVQECRGSAGTETSNPEDTIADPRVGVIRKESEEGIELCSVTCFRADPVCGEDAITYWCGAAEAKCAGVEVAYTGYCDSRSGGAGKDGTRAAQSLFLVHLLWLVLAGFLVVADLL